ncbi:hypothetical protein CRYUN_Cryun11dG0094100 [Craigia yunnanensis]
MAASQRLLCTLSHSLPYKYTPFSFLCSSSPFHYFPFSRSLYFCTLIMPQNQRKGGNRERKWKEKPKSKAVTSASASVAEAVTNKLDGLNNSANNGQIWKPKSYGTVSGPTGSASTVAIDVQTEKSNVDLSKILKPNLLENFNVDNSTYSLAQVRATFYPKFENEKSDQEIRIRMIEVVSKGLATLERNRECISMELVTAVLGDHGQRPREDYAVVTAVTELGNGKPKFYSTPEVIAFCRKWRLPTNHIWLFSTRKSVTSFLAAYYVLCEEGTATSVCRALDEVADISVPGSKDHIKVQGEILEGLVARIVSHESSKHMEEVLKDHPPPPADGAGIDLGPSLREICAANRSDEKRQIKALLQNVGSSFCPDHSDWYDAHSRNAERSVLSKFLQAHPADYSTTKLQEMIRLMRGKCFPAAFKCYHNFQKVESVSSDNLFYKMVIHAHSDSGFWRYQKEMSHKPGLWPLYRGFFLDITLFKANKERAAEIAKSNNDLVGHVNNGSSISTRDGLADVDANLMIKLKFLTYKVYFYKSLDAMEALVFVENISDPQWVVNSFLGWSSCIQGLLPEVRQMKIWGTSAGKQRELSKMLDECLENQALIGSAGNLVRTKDFLAIIVGGRDEEGDLAQQSVRQQQQVLAPQSRTLFRKMREGVTLFWDLNSLIGRYWPKVVDERSRKPYSIILADKNAPNEEVWKQIENMCHSTRASAVPVIPDSEDSSFNMEWHTDKLAAIKWVRIGHFNLQVVLSWLTLGFILSVKACFGYIWADSPLTTKNIVMPNDMLYKIK